MMGMYDAGVRGFGGVRIISDWEWDELLFVNDNKALCHQINDILKWIFTIHLYRMQMHLGVKSLGKFEWNLFKCTLLIISIEYIYIGLFSILICCKVFLMTWHNMKIDS